MFLPSESQPRSPVTEVADMPKETPVSERLLRKSVVDPITGCRNWIGALLKVGYGKIQMPTGKTGGRTSSAHRESWIAFMGPVPAGMCVCHKCDNPRCIRPSHLFIGTFKENTHDMIAKGRMNSPVGERSSAAKLTADKVRIIRERYSQSPRPYQSELAKEFGVDQSQISYIVNRKKWRHIS